MVLSRGNLHAGQRGSLSTRGTAAKNSRPESERLLLLWQYRTKIVWYCLRARVHRRLSTSFRQILLHTALKILAIRKYACKFLPCLQKNLLENPHIFPTNTSSQFRERFPSPQIFQISFAYSFTARSAEKMPALAMLCRDILVHVSLSVYSLELCSCT